MSWVGFRSLRFQAGDGPSREHAWEWAIGTGLQMEGQCRCERT